MAKLSRKATAGAFYRILRKRFGASDGTSLKDPLDRLVLSLFLLRSSRLNSGRALSALHLDFIDWNEVRVASLRELSSLFKAKGCDAKSSVHMKALLQRLYMDTHAISTEHLQKMTAKRARDYVQKTTGLKAYRAAKVLLHAFDLSVPPVSDSMKRVFSRSSLAPDRASDTQFHDAFLAVASNGKRPTANHILETLAADYCVDGTPSCLRCPVRNHCTTGQKTISREKDKAADKTKAKASASSRPKKKAAASTRAKKKAASSRTGKKAAPSSRARKKPSNAARAGKKAPKAARAGKKTSKAKQALRKK